MSQFFIYNEGDEKKRAFYTEKAIRENHHAPRSPEFVAEKRSKLSPFFIKVFDAIINHDCYDLNTGGNLREADMSHANENKCELSFRLHETCETYFRYYTTSRDQEGWEEDFKECAEVWEDILSEVSTSLKVRVRYGSGPAHPGRWAPLYYFMTITRTDI